MKKTILAFALLYLANFSAQTSSKWSDLFSYNNVIAIRDDGQKLIAATENGIFYYTPNTGEIKKLSKANGLHEVKITAFDYDSTTKTGIIGYQSGALDVITPQGIFYVMDIPIATGYQGEKKINHISISGNKAVISVDYGVSIFNIGKREFGETAFFKTNTGYNKALEAGIINNKVIAATENGLVSHDLNPTFPVYTSWVKQEINNKFTNFASKDIIAYSTNNQVNYGADLNSTRSLSRSFDEVKDILIFSNTILVADKERLFVFDKNSGQEQKIVEANEELNSGYYFDGRYFNATKYKSILNEERQSFGPKGPYSNISSRIRLYNDQLLIASGGLDSFAEPILKNVGYYYYDGIDWQYPEYFITENRLYNVTDAIINPNNPKEIIFTNSVTDGYKGIYKITNNQYTRTYFLPGQQYNNRPIGLAVDENNNIFTGLSYALGPDGYTNIGFSYLDKGQDEFKAVKVVPGGGAYNPVAKDGVLYVPAPYPADGGLLMYDYNNTLNNTGDDKSILLNEKNNIPKNAVVCLSIDKNDNAWIGTRKGLRILRNPKAAISEISPQTEAIIIEQNGLGEELFRDAEILRITTDSGNQKWVSIAGGGVFYMSPNGEQTFLHFTKANSPLPNNSVTDIAIDSRNGKVYFATVDGVMVYQGDVAEVTENFGDVLVYPNPVIYAQHKGTVRIKGLAAKTNLRITDASGNLIHSAIAKGGYYEWDLNNIKGARVASGIYFVLMTNEDGTDTKTAKIAVVN